MGNSLSGFRIGIDFGGTKIEVAAVAPDGGIGPRRRVPTPDRYGGALAAVSDLIAWAEEHIGACASVGVGVPGRLDPVTGAVRNANCLNGHPGQRDLSAALRREVRVANDAVCFALSEAATDGAAGPGGGRVVFGAALGTGCGSGLVVDGAPLAGRNGISGEWGHNPFPWAAGEAIPGRRCWCGGLDCLETVISGRGLALDCDGPEGARDAASIAERATSGDAQARAALDRHAERLARALACVVNLLDPEVIVLGGGLSKMGHLYDRLPALMQPRVFGGHGAPVLRPVHGDSSGVRGAAWLWPAAGEREHHLSSAAIAARPAA